MNGSTRQFFWIAICLFIAFVNTGFRESNAADSKFPVILSQELQNQNLASEVELPDYEHPTVFAVLDSEEYPREVIEVIEFDDDENRKKCALFNHYPNSKEKVLFLHPGSLPHKQSNPLYILYCSLRIHLS